MYKLFLTLRYLTRKKIVIFPILVVWLCVMMLIIVTSIMGGFVDRVRKANRELLGDIIISNNNAAGWPHYQKLQERIQKEVPEVEATTPVVRTYGLLNFPDYRVTLPAQLVGIDPEGRAKVSRFRETLYKQHTAPKNAAKFLADTGLPATGKELRQRADRAFEQSSIDVDTAFTNISRYRDGTLGRRPLDERWLIAAACIAFPCVFLLILKRKRFSISTKVLLSVVLIVGTGLCTLVYFWPRMMPRDQEFLIDAKDQAIARNERAYRTQGFAMQLDENRTYKTQQELELAFVPAKPSFDIPPNVLERMDDRAKRTIKHGCIIGVQLGIYRRDQRGNFVRAPERENLRTIMTIVPVSEGGSILGGSGGSSKAFIAIDDSYTGVYDVDSTYVYAPLEVVQEMGFMAQNSEPGKDDYRPAYANEVQIKLKGTPSPEQILRVRDKIEAIAADFFTQPDTMYPFGNMDIQTWDQRQAKYLNAVQNEKRMQIFILGLMSCVVLVVIFLIFYMIVRDKTRDIGIIKAVGGSEFGVMMIFVFYGLFIGAVGGALGVTTGVAFVLHTNEIHEWLYQVFGVMIWDRSVYLFDRIPDQVDYGFVATFYFLSLLSGVLGAAIPAFVAGNQDPVKAVRYE